MRFSILFLILLTSFHFVWGQDETGAVIITEISYNPPESGEDTYEFIELYNPGSQAVNLLNYTFTSGISHVFESGVNLGAAEYLILAKDAIAFEAAFGLAAMSWMDGSLSNGGEAITLRNAMGMVVDSVRYSDGGEWAAAADGAGATLVLCDFTSDNNVGTNWAAANTPTGFVSGGVEMFANPGAASNCVTGATARFLDTELEVAEDAGSVSVRVAFDDLVDQDYSVRITTDDPATTTTLGMDVTVTPLDISFSAGSNTMQIVELTVTILEDMEMEVRENLVLSLVDPSSGLSIDPFANQAVVTILDNDTEIPNLIISEIMYNPPGSDTEGEYLEIYNAGSSTVNLADFYFESGIEYVFPSIDLLAGEYIAITVDSISFQTRFGMAAWEWTSGGLRNSGESVELRDASGNVVDEVTYANGGEWPTEANGSGAALVLCDVNVDNSLAASWSAAVRPTGVFVSGSELLGSPGMMNDCSSPEPPTYTPYPIGVVTTNNENGIPDSLNRRVELTGVVYGRNLFPDGLLFTIIGADGNGIAVFNNNENYDYTVTEGDEVTVRGVIDQFNGLTQLSTDTLLLNSAANTLVDPTTVFELNEDTESQLVQLEGVTVANVVEAGNGLNVTVVDESDNELLMRIDFNTGITANFINGLTDQILIVTGIGGQFDSNEPFTEGYQIGPRYIEDIQIVSQVNEPAWAIDLQLFPQPAATYLQVNSEVEIEQVGIYTLLGQLQSQQLVNARQFELNLNALPEGTYLLMLQHGEERVMRRVSKF